MEESLRWIDVHFHVIPDEFRTLLASRGIYGGIGEPLAPWEASTALAVMDEMRIQTAVASFAIAGFDLSDRVFFRRVARTCNELLADLAHRFPGRFGGFAVLPLPDLDDALRELEHALDTLKLDGVALLSNACGVYLGDPALDPLFEELDRRGTVVHLHPNDLPSPVGRRPPWYPYLVDLPFETTRAAANWVYSGAARRFERVKVILSHAGGAVPFLAGRLATAQFSMPGVVERVGGSVIEALSNLYFDVAMTAPEFMLPALLRLAPPERILFGTDFPYMPREAIPFAISGLTHCDELDEGALRSIASQNAARLFPRIAGSLDGRRSDRRPSGAAPPGIENPQGS